MKKMIELTTKPCSVFKMNKIITESWNPKRLREFLRPARTLFGYNDGAVTISHRLPMHLISSFSTSSQHFYHSTSVQNHTSQNCKSLFLFKNWIPPFSNNILLLHQCPSQQNSSSIHMARGSRCLDRCHAITVFAETIGTAIQEFLHK